MLNLCKSPSLQPRSGYCKPQKLASDRFSWSWVATRAGERGATCISLYYATALLGRRRRGTLAMVGSFSLCFAHLGNDPPPDDDITPPPRRTIINIPWKSPAQEATAIKSAIITVSLKVNRLDSFDPGPQADLWYPLLREDSLVTAGSPHNYLWPCSNVSMFEAICTCWESNWNVRVVAAWPQSDLITAIILIGKLSVSKHLGTNQPPQPSQVNIINMM